MNELVTRLAARAQRVVFGDAERSLAERRAELKAAVDRGYVLLRFTETRGGTELGTPLDEAASDLSRADFAAGEGELRLEGELTLDYVPVRVAATLDLHTLEGQAQLRVLEAEPAPVSA